MLNAYNMGKRLFIDGKADEAMALLSRSLDLGEVLAADQGADALTLRGLGRVHSYIGEIETNRQRFSEAEVAYRRSNDLFRQIFEREPLSLEGLTEYCVSCGQLQSFLSARGKFDEATRQAEHVCRLLEDADKGGRRPEQEMLRIRQRRINAHYGLELQHRDNYIAHDEKDKKRADQELEAMAGACRKTIELADALQPICPNDADLEYWNAASRFNLHQILVEQHGRSEETEQLLTRACDLMQGSLKKEPNEDHRREFEIFKEARKQYDGKGR